MSQFEFKDISYYVGKNHKKIISNAAGFVRNKEVFAILGPSGAGKTSLLNVLTLNALSGESTGTCTLSGEKMSNDVLKKYCCIVPQLDQHEAFLTCRETLRFAANFYIDDTAEKKDAEVDLLLNKLGLNVCADARVGNIFLPGLSGGQKKRLSIGLALLKKPKVMLLDEPTSGLDAAASYHVMNYIKSLAKEFDIAVIATIHQPSSYLYSNFDRVMLLSQGRTAFFGTPARSLEYFKAIGHTIPEHSNPAEFLLDVINNEFTDPAQVKIVLDLWEEKKSSEESANTAYEYTPLTTDGLTQLSIWTQFGYVFNKQTRIVSVDPMIYLGRGIMFLFACSFFAVVYIEARIRDQDQALNRLWASMWFMGVPTSLGVVAVYAFNEEFKTVKKEIKNGMYHVNAYLLSSFAIQVPALIVLALFAIAIPGFAMLNFYGPNFVPIIGLYACVFFTYEAIARALSVAFDNPLMGMLNFLQIWFTSFLFAGVMIPEDMVIWPLRIFCYILPLKWGIASIAYLDANEEKYRSAHPCPYPTDPACLTHDGDSIGWKCDSDIELSQCYGYTGTQVLDTLGGNYEAVSSENNVLRNFGIIIAIAFVFQLQFMVIAGYLADQNSKIVDTLGPGKSSPNTTPNSKTGQVHNSTEMIPANME